MTYARRSPIQDWFQQRARTWRQVHGMSVPEHVADPAGEREHTTQLALADVSALDKLGVKGTGAAEFLKGQGITPPENVYDWIPLAGNAGKVIRVKRDEFFLESGVQDSPIPALRQRLLGHRSGCLLVERQDAGFLLAGANTAEVLPQTCAVDLRANTGRLVMTSMAGVSVMILAPKDLSPLRVWCEASHARYLWDSLYKIVCDLDGAAVGFDSVAHLL